MSLSLDAAVRSEIGHVRTGNEDAAFAGPRLIAVADGMGGHAAGEVASQIAISALAPLDEDAAGADILGALHDALEEANSTLRDMVHGDASLEGMGTTVTALLSSGRRLGLVHIGDSRAYLLRTGELARITRDHTLVQTLIDAGEITEDQAQVHPQRSMIMKAVDGSEITPDLRVREAVAGDRYLLCSDGLTGVVSEATLSDVLSTGTPQQAVDTLVELALKAGGPDNVTVIVADVVEHQVEGTPQVAGAAALPDATRPSAAARLSAAGRAALARAQPGRPAAVGTPPVPPPGAARRGPRVLRPLVVVPLALVVLLAVVTAGIVLYLHSQFYVGVDGGQVVVFRGVPGSVAGLDLQSVDRRIEPVDALVDGARRQVEKGIPARDRTDAERIAASLQHRSVAPTPAAVPVPAATPAPPATGAPTATPATAPVPAVTP